MLLHLFILTNILASDISRMVANNLMLYYTSNESKFYEAEAMRGFELKLGFLCAAKFLDFLFFTNFLGPVLALHSCVRKY
jgi:hypothetical protein